MINQGIDRDPHQYKHTKTKSLRVLVTLTDGTRIEGSLHTPNLRLVDLLNRHINETPFLAVTDAKVAFPGGEQGSFKFFGINRKMIVCCFPQEESVSDNNTHDLQKGNLI